jgi:hypothetical protein
MRLRNRLRWLALGRMSSAQTIAKPLVRAIRIYATLARHGVDLWTRRDLARHIKKLAEQGLEDPGRLTVHGLSFLRSRERQSNTSSG